MTEPSPSLLSAEVTGVNELPCSAAWFFSLELEIIFQATPGMHQTHSVWRLFVLMLRGCYVSGAWSMHFLWKAKMVNYVDGRTLWWSLLCCCGMGANMAVTVMGVAMFQLLGQSQLVCWHLILCVCFLFFFSPDFYYLCRVFVILEARFVQRMSLPAKPSRWPPVLFKSA